MSEKIKKISEESEKSPNNTLSQDKNYFSKEAFSEIPEKIKNEKTQEYNKKGAEKTKETMKSINNKISETRDFFRINAGFDFLSTEKSVFKPESIISVDMGGYEEIKNLIANSQNLDEFKKKMKEIYGKKETIGKLVTLSSYYGVIGELSGNKGNIDEIDSNDQFESLKKYITNQEIGSTGSCRNISHTVAKEARNLGFSKSYVGSTTTDERHEFVVIDTEDGNINVIDDDRIVTFKKDEYLKYLEYHSKEYGSMDFVEKIYDPNNGKVLGYISTPMMDLLKNEQAGYKGVEKLSGEDVKINFGPEINLKTDNIGSKKIQLGYGKESVYFYIDGGELKESVFQNGTAKYIGTGIKVKIEQDDNWSVDGEVKVTKGNLDFDNGKSLDNGTIYLSAKYTQSLMEGWGKIKLFGEGGGLVRKDEYDSKYGIKDGIGYIGTGYEKTFGKNIKAEAGITSHVDVNGVKNHSIDLLPGYYANGEIKIGDGKIGIGTTSNPEGEKVYGDLSYNYGKGEIRTGIEKTDYKNKIQESSNGFSLGIDYDILKNANIILEYNKNNEYGQDNSKVSLETNINF